ncbi:MAG TPA: PEP-CTERM sorting domain-containing protein, partial [Lacipirellulaceae bacterium]
YSPVGGESYTLLTANSITGSNFRATSLPMLPDGLTWDLDIGADSVVLSVMGSLPGLPGDYNGNGVVDAADYVVWRKKSGTQEEYNTWRANFGRTSGAASLSDVTAPEPASFALLMLGAAVASWRRSSPQSRTSRRLLL